MNYPDIVHATRSCRRFSQERSVTPNELLSLIDLTRYTASAANQQPLRYRIITAAGDRDNLFGSLTWGSAMPWNGPEESERPSGYILMLQDTEVTKRVYFDPGIAAATITYGATTLGYGSCILASIDREKLRRDFSIPDRYTILLVIAVGLRGERVIIDRLKSPGDSVTYYRDAEGVHHVPKRQLKDILI